jgi:phenylalanyl-tRNA synthetase beta chain
MDILYSWLLEYLPVKLSAAEAAELLTNTGLEASARGAVKEDLLQQMDKVLIARIEKIEKHPNADKLTLCRVRPAQETAPLAIVCGAPNIKEGDLVPLALPGAMLPNGMAIKESLIRGALSQGMMCSQKELGVGEDHSGIWILPKDAPLGRPLKEWLLSQELVITVEPTPNRGDLFCVLGVARELAAAAGGKARLPEIKLREEPTVIEEKAEVVIEDHVGCPRYVARLVEEVKIGPSPDWMKKRLETSGIRAIANVVDVTNYVMLELGQPLHAFDYELLRQHKIVVRRAKQGEKFVTLDGIERVLASETLLICDGQGPVAVAGIMGGANSEVKETTRNILIESAFFSPKVIRRGAARLGMQTEASKRFEHHIDPLATAFAADRAAQLMAELAGAKVLKGRLDVYEKLLEPQAISFRLNQVKRHLGFEVEKKTVVDFFNRLNMKTEERGQEDILVTPPPYRPDLSREIDLIEEVARLYGYENIQAELPEYQMQVLPRSRRELLRKNLRLTLKALGFSEVINYNFQSSQDQDHLLLPDNDPRRQAVRIQNPVAENLSHLRTSLLPGLLANLAFNLARQQSEIKIFEFNKIFLKNQQPGEPLLEKEMLAGIIAREQRKTLWSQACPEGGFYEVKSVAETVFAELYFPGARIEQASDVPYLLPGKTAKLMLGKERAGQLGELDPRVLKAYGVNIPAFAVEIDFELLLKYQRKLARAEIPSRFPASYRDISFIVDEQVTNQQVVIAINQLKSELIAGIELFDIFRGAKLPAGRKSMAYRIWYQAADRTLTDNEVSVLHAKVAVKLKEKLGAELR